MIFISVKPVQGRFAALFFMNAFVLNLLFIHDPDLIHHFINYSDKSADFQTLSMGAS